MRHSWAFLALAAEAARNPNAVSGVGKVVALLEEMMEKGKAESQAEKETFSKFSQWCAGTQSQLETAITNNKEVIALQTATYEENTAIANDKAAAITAADNEIAGLEAEIAKAKDERAHQLGAFRQMESELEANIAACEQAKGFLKNERDSPKNAKDAFLQVAQKMSATQRSTVQLLMHLGQEPGWKHENKSGQVIQMIDDLMAEFVANLQGQRVKENNQKGAHNTIVTQKHGQIKLKQDDIGRWSHEKGAAESAAALADETRASEQATLEENHKTESDVKLLCEKKSNEFELRQKLREEEFVAIEQATQALHGAVGSGKDTEANVSSFASFLQLGKKNQDNSTTESLQKVSSLFKAAGEKHNSKQLLLLSVSVAEGGPFEKIIGMVKALRRRLIEEQQQATGKHMKCKAMMEENKQSIKETESDIATFTQKIDECAGTISQKTEEIANLLESQKQSDATIKKKSELRAEESAENANTVADAKQAIEGIELAMKILSEFQAGASQATALVQQPVKISVPGTWDQPYTGQGEGGSILDVLQILMEEFQTEKTDTEMDESNQKKEHEDFLYDEKVAKTQRDANLDNAQKLKADAEEDHAKAETDLGDSNQEHKSLKATKKDIEVNQGCVAFAGMTVTQVHEAEAAKRDAEIESLKQGLEILNGVSQQ